VGKREQSCEKQFAKCLSSNYSVIFVYLEEKPETAPLNFTESKMFSYLFKTKWLFEYFISFLLAHKSSRIFFSRF